MKYLVVVDMQNDFVGGCLGSADAAAVAPYIEKAVREFEGEVIFTRDTHGGDYMETQEGARLPVPHCIKGSAGWEIVDGLKALSEGRKIIDKPTFGSTELMDHLAGKGDAEMVTFMGVCTDICVISNAFLVKAAMPECRVVVDSKGCAGTSKEAHDNALKAMAGCQMEII